MYDDKGNWIGTYEPLESFAGYSSPAEYEEHLRSLEAIKRLRNGDWGLEWLRAEPGTSPLWAKWGVKAEPSKRGLTLMDIDRALADFPTLAFGSNTRATRGSGVEPGEAAAEWEINAKVDVWAENVTTLYEEACSRQWNATRDIEWGSLEMLNPTYERAFCQFSTFLANFEYRANDLIAPFIPRINTHFYEVKCFLATQLMDEARHSEVFRKRCLANGGGLGMNINLPLALELPGMVPSYAAMSYGIHVLFEGVILDIFRFGEFLGQNEADKQIFRLVMQDEARHVAYGTMHLDYYLQHKGDDRQAAIDELEAFCKVAEPFIAQILLLNPSIVEALALCAVGGDIDKLDKGMEIVGIMFKSVRREYLRRLERSGMGSHAAACMIPEDPPFLPKGHDLSRVEDELVGAR